MSAQPTLPSVRKTLLRSDAAFDCCIAYYPPGHVQAEHDHGCSQFSIILAGGLTERVGGVEHQAGPAEISVKPKGVVHSNQYGPAGALLLSYNVRCDRAASAIDDGRSWHWRMVRPGSCASLVKQAVQANGAQADDHFWDMFSIAERRRAGAIAPGWLRWARSQLDQPAGATTAIADLAAQAGVHRVHLSREFVRHFGLTPSTYRLRQMSVRAIRARVDGGALPAAAAHDAGFVDQSHMARAIRASFGSTPRQLTALLGR